MFLTLALLFLHMLLFHSGNFVRKRKMFYGQRREFTVEDSEISGRTIYFRLNFFDSGENNSPEARIFFASANYLGVVRKILDRNLAKFYLWKSKPILCARGYDTYFVFFIFVSHLKNVAYNRKSEILQDLKDFN